MVNHTKLGFRDRELLAKWKQEGLSNKQCAKRLGRHVSTIGRELRRNQFHGQWTKFYEPLYAQAKAQVRKQKAWRAKHPLKNAKVYRYVIKRLLRGWSPEQIAGRLKEIKHSGDPSWHICHETIYRFIYQQSQKHRKWWQYLRRGRVRRRIRGGRRVHRCRIPERVSIHKRPQAVNDREEFGHWEGDSVVGKGRNHGLHTSYERVSSLYRFTLMKSLTAEASCKAQINIYGQYPQAARKTTTLDNGSEHAGHKTVEAAVGIKTYFADPYSAWQRGGNENANLWLRYYFPKGTDFRTIPPEELKAVEWELNNRPRKRLGFKTPQEVFDKQLKGCNRS